MNQSLLFILNFVYLQMINRYKEFKREVYIFDAEWFNEQKW